jgi:hypothetical protein
MPCVHADEHYGMRLLRAIRGYDQRCSLETVHDIVRLRILPAFGSKKLKDLSREHVQKFYSRKRVTRDFCRERQAYP